MAFRLVFLFRRLCVCLYWAQPEISFILLLKGLYWGGVRFLSRFPIFFFPKACSLSGSVPAFFAHSFGFHLSTGSRGWSSVYVFSSFVIQAARIGGAAFTYLFSYEYSTGGLDRI